MTITLKYPCGHTKQVNEDDHRFAFEANGVRVTEGVHYCHECYQQDPKRFTWLEPGQTFQYIQTKELAR